MNRRFWCILCSAFLAYNLKLLFDGFYSTNYKLVEVGDNLHDETTKIAACTHSSNIVKKNQDMGDKAIKLKQVNVDVRSFLRVSIEMIENCLDTKNLFSVDQSYIFRGFICFLLNQTTYERNQKAREFLKEYSVFLFAYSPGKQPFLYEYVFRNYINPDSLKIIKQKVYGPQYLASSNCRNQRDQFLASKLNCLRKCDFRWPTDRSFSWPADFDPPDSDRLYDLIDLIEKKPERGDLHPSNHFEKNSDNETFRKCIQRCPKEDCYSETYDSITVKNGRMEINIKTEIFRAYYSSTQFWSQFFGLLTLFTSTSVTDTVPHLMSLAAKKLKTSHQAYFVRFLPKIKLSLVIFSSIFILAQSILMITDYRFEKSFPNKTIIWNFSSEPFSVIICLPVETLFYGDKKIEKDRNLRILGSSTFKQLEIKTRAFENGVEAIKLLHGNQIKNLSWTMSEKVLFKNSSCDGRKCLSRCFRIELAFEDLKYRKMMPFYYLTIRFRTPFREVYLVEKHQNFSSGLVDFKGDYFVRKRTKKRLPGSRKSNCREMKEGNQREKIDRCINQRFLNEHSALPVNSVVDRDDFGDKIADYKFEETDTKSIERNCIATYGHLKACKEVRFKESMKKMGSYDSLNITLNLYYEDSISKEIDQSSIKVLLYILNLESIFFKNNIASVLLFLFAVLKRTFKLNWSASKINRFLVLSFCFLGFFVHNVFVFKGIVDEKLVQNGYFKIMRQFTIPNTVFCFDLSKFEPDENHKMTGNYLESLTNEMRLSNIIRDATYFNRTHFNHVSHSWSRDLRNYSNSELTISPLYLLDSLFCLEFQLNVKFDEEDFYILINKFVLVVYFKKSFTERVSETYLFYRQPGQKEVGDLLKYKIGPKPWPIYEIVLEIIEIDRHDDFEDWKDLRRLFFGKRRVADKNDYLNEIQAKFSAGNLKNFTTNEIPLERINFGKEIDNELFRQFYLQVTNVTDHQQPTSLNSKLKFFNFYSQRPDLDFLTFFQFTILPISKRVEILNNENYAKLIQDILNR